MATFRALEGEGGLAFAYLRLRRQGIDARQPRGHPEPEAGGRDPQHRLEGGGGGRVAAEEKGRGDEAYDDVKEEHWPS